jgi:signal transduction histidine kinase
MKKLKSLFTPIVTLLAIQVLWILILVFWVIWFFKGHYELRNILERYRPESIPPHVDWPVLVTGIVLLFLILIGMYSIFIFWKRQSRLYATQKNFISQLGHEFKSPLASIQLHLETIQLRQPPPEKMERFLETMLIDTNRLNNLISNMLMSARLEQKRTHISLKRLPVIDFSSFISNYIKVAKKTFLAKAELSVEIESDIKIKAETDGVEMVLRNILENALFYNSADPEIKVILKKTGKFCQLSIEDNGKGIEKKEFKNIFRKFYRIKSDRETISGTGLGLYIVKSILKRYSGKISVHSDGKGKGSAFKITVPCVTN